MKKSALDFTQEGRAYSYHPLVTEAECATTASEVFLDRVFGGSLQPMLAHFMEHKRLSTKEVKELKRLLGERE